MTEEQSKRWQAALDYAAAEGRTNGHAAASWYFDGNTTDATYRAVRDGIADGDPAVLDTLPAPDLSGEWADMPTGPSLTRDALADAGYEHAEDGPMGHAPGACDTCDAFDCGGELADAYEDAFREAVESSISKAIAYQLGIAADGTTADVGI